MKGKRERTLDAYRDGGLTERQSARVRGWLSSDADSRSYVERTDALGRAVRETWTEGPPAPSPDRIMAAIRPAMRRIDAERRDQSGWKRAQRALAPIWSDVSRSSWEWATAAGVAAASIAGTMFMAPAAGEVRREAQHLVAMPTLSAAPSGVSFPSSIYDLAQGDTPLRVYEKEGATVIYLGEEPDPDDISFGLVLADWA